MKYEKERNIVQKLLEDYLNDDSVLLMKNYMQHGDVSTYIHCFNVALMSYIICTKFNIKVCIMEMLIGAILHDFYLYDWHDGRIRKNGLHGFTHPTVALANANERFSLTKKEQNIIDSHMFPMTITKIPKSKEAIIVSIADKICAIKEYLHL